MYKEDEKAGENNHLTSSGAGGEISDCSESSDSEEVDLEESLLVFDKD